MPDIHHLIRIRATAEQVYRALTTADGIRQWWTREADLDGRVGGTGEFRFYQGTGVTRVRVEALEPARRVAWRTISAVGAPGDWAGTTIAFALRTEGEDTVLAFAHRGFAAAGEGFALVTTGWAYYLVSLRQYLETGEGAPQQEKDLARILRPGAGAMPDGAAGTDIVHSVEIEASPARVFDALTTSAGLAGWWTPDAQAAPGVGALTELGFGSETRLAFRVERLELARHVAWSGVRVPPDWAGTRIRLDIDPAGDAARLRFAQGGFPPHYDHRGADSYLWSQYLRSLKLLLETGRGEPYGSPGSRAAGTTPHRGG